MRGEVARAMPSGGVNSRQSPVNSQDVSFAKAGRERLDQAGGALAREGARAETQRLWMKTSTPPLGRFPFLLPLLSPVACLLGPNAFSYQEEVRREG